MYALRTERVEPSLLPAAGIRTKCDRYPSNPITLFPYYVYSRYLSINISILKLRFNILTKRRSANEDYRWTLTQVDSPVTPKRLQKSEVCKICMSMPCMDCML